MAAVKEGPPSEVIQITVEEEMKRSYMDYAMSVIVSRALPDVRDGLKPVHRRILYSMMESGFEHNKPHRKSARITGDVLGKYHPHGEAAIYETMVRMAQKFSLRLMLVDGQGNFGSMDGDKAASARYTEARLTRASHFLLEDYDKNTVDFQPNYDGSLMMPTVLPARFPNILVNGAGGIAVGMATNIPPHNLGELINACCALIDTPDMSIEELMHHVPGPDFPTGALIMGRRGIHDAYRTGRGSILMRSKCHFEEMRKDHTAIVVTEIPYQVNKARLVERIAELVHAKELDGISDLRDESDRHGVRVVIELKRDAIPDIILNRLYAMTPLQTSFGVNMLAINGGRPVQMNLQEILQAFLDFREEVVVRRTRFFLSKARERAHIVMGLLVAVSNIDEVVALIRRSEDPAHARRSLMERIWKADEIIGYIERLGKTDTQLSPAGYQLSETQARAILDLRLHRLTGLEQGKLKDEMNHLEEKIRGYLELLSSRPLLLDLIKTELQEVKALFADPRRTTLEDGEAVRDDESLIQREDMVVTFSLNGYIKRVPLGAYRAQKRGGRGKSAMTTREQDIVSQVFVANTHTPLLFFSSQGKAYQLKVYELPLASPQSRGKSLVNVLPFATGETLSTLMHLPEDPEAWRDYHILFVTSAGNVRRNNLSDFQNIRSSGKIAMKLEEEGERLIAVHTCQEGQDVLLTTRKGRSIRFEVAGVRCFTGRTSTGVRGIRLTAGDEVVAMSIIEGTPFSPEEREVYLRQASKLRRGDEDAEASSGSTLASETDENTLLTLATSLTPERFEEMKAQEQFILTVSERGFGKRTSAYAYRRTNRGGQGVATMEVNIRNGMVLNALPVQEEDNLLLVTQSGQLIRCPVHDIRIAGRRTQGVTIFRMKKDDKVVSVVPCQEMGDIVEEAEADPDNEAVSTPEMPNV